MGVRVDVPGVVKRDYHTLGKDGFWQAKGAVQRKNVMLTYRYYLADARFLVGLEGKEMLLHWLHEALRAPVWPLYLGRKAFVPSQSVWLCDGLRPDEELEEALKAYPWLGNERYERPDKLRLVLEDAQEDEATPSGVEGKQLVQVSRDQPVAFTSLHRRFLPRRVRIKPVEAPKETWKLEEERRCISPD